MRNNRPGPGETLVRFAVLTLFTAMSAGALTALIYTPVYLIAQSIK